MREKQSHKNKLFGFSSLKKKPSLRTEDLELVDRKSISKGYQRS